MSFLEFIDYFVDCLEKAKQVVKVVDFTIRTYRVYNPPVEV